MKTDEWDAYLLGRKLIEGIATASRLALLVCSVVERTEAGTQLTKYVVSCREDVGIRLTSVRWPEEEGFEFENERDPEQLNSPSSFKTKSNQVQRTSNSSEEAHKQTAKSIEEVYPINDVAFCHTDKLFPKILVIAVKTKSTARQPTCVPFSHLGGLEAIILQFQREEKLKELCTEYNELRRRIKLNFTMSYTRSRRNNSKNKSHVLHTFSFDKTQFYIARPADNSSSGKETLSGSYKLNEELTTNSFNLVQRTDDDGITHIEVMGGDQDHTENNCHVSQCTSSIISINTPDVGNLVTEPPDRPFKRSQVRCTKQIESVIRTDLEDDDYSNRKTNAWPITPPKRPERKKQLRKITNLNRNDQGNINIFVACKEGGENSRLAVPDYNKNKVISGMFISVIVDPKQTAKEKFEQFETSSSSVGPSKQIELKNDNPKVNYSPNETQGSTKRTPTRGHWGIKRVGDKCRTNVDKIRPTQQTPTGYSYIDTVPKSNSLSNRFFGKLRELATGSVIATSSYTTKKNNRLDQSKEKYYKYIQSESTKSTPNLKSVIKTKYKEGPNENPGPKRVTFSAFATVQVVD